MRGEAGTRALLRLLDRQVFRLTDSELERGFAARIRACAEDAGARDGSVAHGFRVDFFWPELGLVVETDGLRYHRTRRASAGPEP